jgi:hypothetical protein
MPVFFLKLHLEAKFEKIDTEAMRPVSVIFPKFQTGRNFKKSWSDN